MRVLRASMLYFALVFGAGFVLGTLRVVLVVPILGVRTAELLEMPLMGMVILFAARFVHRRAAKTLAPGEFIPVGVIALLLMIGAELLLAYLLQHQTIPQYVASRDPVSGSVYVAMLLVFAALPAMLAVLRKAT